MRSTLFDPPDEDDEHSSQSDSGKAGDGNADHRNIGDYYPDPTDHWRSRSTGQFVPTPRD